MDLHTQADRVARRSPGLNREVLVQAVHLLSPEGNVWAGFEAVRRLAIILPALWPLLPGLCTPGASFLGPAVYGWISRNRHRFGGCGPVGACPVHFKPEESPVR